jgi:hypothetical protein
VSVIKGVEVTVVDGTAVGESNGAREGESEEMEGEIDGGTEGLKEEDVGSSDGSRVGLGDG